MQPPVAKLHSGGGRVSVSLHAARAVCSELSSTYPLKLLSPHISNDTALVFLLTYGGGLVGGDEIDLTVRVNQGAKLVLLSQGSTKVFKARMGTRLASATSPVISRDSTANSYSPPVSPTTQHISFTVESRGLLLLLPEPVTCFQDASYNQIQRFDIKKDGSIVILDWITSGRISIGEQWAFSRYYSLNEIWYDGKRIAKDVMLLDHHELEAQAPARPLRKRLEPYSCYAMVILHGPQTQGIIADIVQKYDEIAVFKMTSPSALIWSLSPMDSTKHGVVIRVAGMETEIVREWLKQALSRLQSVIGAETYGRAFP